MFPTYLCLRILASRGNQDANFLRHLRARRVYDSSARHLLELVGSLENLELDLETYKKILNIVHVGKFYYWILDVSTATVAFTSPEIANVLGYTPEEFTMSLFFQIIHPDDVSYFINFENKVVEFFYSLDIDRIFKYKVRSEKYAVQPITEKVKNNLKACQKLIEGGYKIIR